MKKFLIQSSIAAAALVALSAQAGFSITPLVDPNTLSSPNIVFTPGDTVHGTWGSFALQSSTDATDYGDYQFSDSGFNYLGKVVGSYGGGFKFQNVQQTGPLDGSTWTGDIVSCGQITLLDGNNVAFSVAYVQATLKWDVIRTIGGAGTVGDGSLKLQILPSSGYAGSDTFLNNLQTYGGAITLNFQTSPAMTLQDIAKVGVTTSYGGAIAENTAPVPEASTASAGIAAIALIGFVFARSFRRAAVTK